MLARLRHHPVIARDHQQGVIDPAHAREHIGKKLLVAGHVDKAQHATVGLRPVGVTRSMVMPRFFSSGRRSAFTPVMACNNVVLPWST